MSKKVKAQSPKKQTEFERFLLYYHFERASTFLWYKCFDRNNCQSVVFLHLLSDLETIRLSVSDDITGMPYSECYDFHSVSLLETKNPERVISQFLFVLTLR